VTALGALEHGSLRGGAAYRALVEEIDNSTGVSREAAPTFENTARGMRIFLAGTIQTIRILLGEMLAPAITGLLWLLRTISGAFLNLIRQSPALARVLSWLALGMTVLLITGGSLILMFSGIALFISTLIPLITMAGTAMAALSALAAVAAPLILPVLAGVGVAIAGIGAVIGFVIALIESYRRNLGGLADFVNGVVTDIKLIWDSLVFYFRENAISDAIIEQLQDRKLLGIVLWILGFTLRLEEIWRGLSEVVVPAVGLIVGAFEFLLKTVISLVSWFGELLKSMGIKFSADLTFWRVIGWVFGVLIVGAIIAVIAVVGALAIAFGVMAIAALIAFSPIILAFAAFAAIVFGIVTLVGWVIDTISMIIEEGLGNVIRDIGIYFGGLWHWISSGFMALEEIVASFMAKAYKWGEDLVGGFLEGIQSKWNDLVNWLSSSLTSITNLLPSSDAIEGPLSNLSGQGQAFVTTFQTGIEGAMPGFVSNLEAGPLATAANVVTPPAGMPVEAAPATKNVTINVEGINISVQQASPEEAERLADLIMLRLQELQETETEASFA
jgi:hypothetical protein